MPHTEKPSRNNWRRLPTRQRIERWGYLYTLSNTEAANDSIRRFPVLWENLKIQGRGQTIAPIGQKVQKLKF